MKEYVAGAKILVHLSEEEKNSLTIDNPYYYQTKRLGFSVRGIPKTLKLYEEHDGYFSVPRCLLPYRITLDRRVDGEEVEFKSIVIPRDSQQAEAIRILSQTEEGILEAGTGKGKTIIALDALAMVGRPTLILVHKGFLVDQWQERIREFLGEEAGVVKGSKCQYKGRKIVIGMLQSICSHPYPEDFYSYFGLVISDEVHRISAPSWSTVIGKFPARRRWGLTATTKRPDGLECIFHAHMGGIVYTMQGVDVPPEVQPVVTDFHLDPRLRFTTARLINAISMDQDRNKLILSLLMQSIKKGRQIMVLGDRLEQLKLLKAVLDEYIGEKVRTALYIGETSKSDREDAEENADVIFGTLSLAKEGLDIPRIDTLFLITPVGSPITVTQAVGRIARKYDGKKQPLVLDFIDKGVGQCLGLWNKRVKVYQQLKYKIRGFVR
jgi:superfamily II DNA or RNA helicase